MKKLLLLILIGLIAESSIGQYLGDELYDINFEDTTSIHHLRIDSVANQNNLWQVGVPQKTIFTGSYSWPKAKLTDTLHSYPTNDTSSFEIVNLATGEGWQWPHTVILYANYKVNSDSLTDFGKIEISPDNGTTWIDLINDTTYSSYYQWYNNKPVLTGNSNGWQNFTVWLAGLGPLFNVHINDTILYRFTFISDSVETNKDGLMFDDFHFEDWAEGIKEVENNSLISISPNPASDELNIRRTNAIDKDAVQILNYTGQVLFENSHFLGETIAIRQLENGIYLLKYSNTKNISIKKFIVQH